MRKGIFAACYILAMLNLQGCIDEAPHSPPPQTDTYHLIGNYTSDCYFSGAFNQHVIENLIYSTTSFTNRIDRFADNQCATGVTESLNTFGSITYSDTVATTDGLTAFRADFDTDTGGAAPQFETVFPTVYRKDADALNFGPFVEGQIPTVNYTITYRQTSGN